MSPCAREDNTKMDISDLECKVVVLVDPVEDNGQLSNFCTFGILQKSGFSVNR